MRRRRRAGVHGDRYRRRQGGRRWQSPAGRTATAFRLHRAGYSSGDLGGNGARARARSGRPPPLTPRAEVGSEGAAGPMPG